MAAFSAQVKAFADKANRQSTTVARRFAMDIFRRVIMRTPVDTGRARGNWQTQIGSPAAGVVETKDKGGGPTVAAAVGVAGGWNPADGSSIFLSNNLPYIDALENGWSGQAPAGMVAITLAEFHTVLEIAVRESENAG